MKTLNIVCKSIIPPPKKNSCKNWAFEHTCSHKYTRLSMSFWKQEPPKPTEAIRNLFPIRVSAPIAEATWLTSAPEKNRQYIYTLNLKHDVYCLSYCNHIGIWIKTARSSLLIKIRFEFEGHLLSRSIEQDHPSEEQVKKKT